MSKQCVHCIHIVQTGRPVQGRLAILVACVDIFISLDQVFNHSFNGQPCSQYERSGAIYRLGVEVSGSVTKKNLENALSISRHSCMKRSSSCVVLSISICFGVQQFLSSISSGIARGEVQRSL